MKNVGIYFMINESCAKSGIISDVNAAIQRGAKVIHYSEKKLRKREVLENSYILSALCKKSNVLFIVEDYPDIASLVGADGVYLTQQDFSINHVRRIIGNGKYIGVQFHSLKEATDAEEKGADYINIGLHTEILTKNTIDKLKKMKEFLTLPIIAVGNFSNEQIKELCLVGVDGVAVLPGHDVEATRRLFKK